MIELKLNKHAVENFKAVQTMRKRGYTDEEIQQKVDEQNAIDEGRTMKKKIEGKTVLQCEKYRLEFTHDVICSSGERMRLEEPFTVEINCMYGEPYPRELILDKLFCEMKQRLKEV